MSLNLENLKKAIDALDRSVGSAEKGIAAGSDANTIETLKAGVIQNFEVAYEQCWKIMKRWLEKNIGSEAVDGVTRRELFRYGAENNLIQDVDFWMEFHKARNETSHTYNEVVADKVYVVAKAFAPAAKQLLERLEARLGGKD